MSNLFSIFDPTTGIFLITNWIITIINILLVPMNFWIKKSRLNLIMFKIMMVLKTELSIILKTKFNYLNILLFLSMFIFIFNNNFTGLFPYIFTSSSHLVFPLTLAIPLYLSLMIFSWTNNSNFMFLHMIPQGTPIPLMPFMTLIETISNIIRPATLAIRLTANMIAGHLLLTLMSESTTTTILIISTFIIASQTLLLTLELSVSIIQSYVFTILNTLYMKETNYD